MTGADDERDRVGCDQLRDELLNLCGRAAERLDLPIEWHLQALAEAMANLVVVKAEAENGDDVDKEADRVILHLFSAVREAVRAHYTRGTPS